MTLSQISLKPVLPSDFLAIARLEAAAFEEDKFSAVAFGAHRFSDAAMKCRAKSLAEGPKPGETFRNIKAVTTLPDGTVEIVGFASWTICIGRTGSEEEKKRLGMRKGWAEKKGEKNEEEKDPFGPGANLKFCEDALIRGDEHMSISTEGKDYAKLFTLVVSPNYQRRGIGSLLFKDFVHEADEAGLQAILGASPVGIGLYRKYGFVDFRVMNFKLWEYDGGKGMGIARHVIMHRPAVTKGSSK